MPDDGGVVGSDADADGLDLAHRAREGRRRHDVGAGARPTERTYATDQVAGVAIVSGRSPEQLTSSPSTMATTARDLSP